MILSAHQPAYLPWLGYFAKMAASDAFVLHDLSCIGRGNMLNRNRIRTAGGPKLLSVPLLHEDLRAEKSLNAVRILDDGWRRKHWGAIQHAYRRAPYFADHSDFLADYFSQPYETLDDLCAPFIDYCTTWLAIECPVYRTSSLALDTLDRTELIPQLCKRFGADSFIVGPQSRNYLDLDGLATSGSTITEFEYDHPEYPQIQEEFVSHLSVLDLMMNCGPRAADVIRKGIR